MNRISYIILSVTLIVGLANAGESIFGISDKSIGFLAIPYSASGMARSYEIANNDSLHLNFRNYSLWTNIANTTYTVKARYSASFSSAQIPDGKEDDYFNDVANFQGGFLGLPILKKKLVLGLGLQPVSNMEQRFLDSLKTGINEQLLIKGGLSRAVINLSYNILPNIGIGLGYEYNFGKITETHRLEFVGSSVSTLSFAYDYRFYGNGIVVSAYANAFDKLRLGFMVRTPVSLKARIKAKSNSVAVNESEEKDLTLPAQFNIGMEYQISSRMTSGIDFIYQDWKGGYKIEGVKVDKYQDKFYRIGVGFERKSSETRFTKLSEQIDYRLGFFYGNLNQTSGGNSVKEYGISLGFSLPVQRFKSRIDFAGIIGKRGNLDNNIYEETFVSFGISICASEIWFLNIDD